MEKGEIARSEQFLLFSQCFQKQSVVDVLKRVWNKEIKHILCSLYKNFDYLNKTEKLNSCLHVGSQVFFFTV